MEYFILWNTIFFSDEEELKHIEKNRLKRKKCVLTYLPDVPTPTPKYGTTYGCIEGGIIRSCEKSQSSSRIKKRVSFHEGLETLGKEDCHVSDVGRLQWSTSSPLLNPGQNQLLGESCDSDMDEYL